MNTDRWSAAPVLVLLLCTFVLCQSAVAQQTQHLVKNSQAAPARKKHKSILDLIPFTDYRVDEHLPPLTPTQKFNLALSNFASPLGVAEAAAKAEFYRGTEPSKKIGYGGTGYLKQWGASYLDEISGGMLGSFIYPTLFRQDPRYYRKARGSIISRVAYCFSQVFITRGDSGRTEFNASLVLASATTTVLSNAYYPPRSRGVGPTFSNIGWALLGDGGGNIFTEFWPDFAGWLRKR
ncbi:MAG: hypothetical protein ACRD2B_05775 [Terriglobia bacterium]